MFDDDVVVLQLCCCSPHSSRVPALVSAFPQTERQTDLQGQRQEVSQTGTGTGTGKPRAGGDTRERGLCQATAAPY